MSAILNATKVAARNSVLLAPLRVRETESSQNGTQPLSYTAFSFNANDTYPHVNGLAHVIEDVFSLNNVALSFFIRFRAFEENPPDLMNEFPISMLVHRTFGPDHPLGPPIQFLDIFKIFYKFGGKNVQVRIRQYNNVTHPTPNDFVDQEISLCETPPQYFNDIGTPIPPFLNYTTIGEWRLSSRDLRCI